MNGGGAPEYLSQSDMLFAVDTKGQTVSLLQGSDISCTCIGIWSPTRMHLDSTTWTQRVNNSKTNK